MIVGVIDKDKNKVVGYYPSKSLNRSSEYIDSSKYRIFEVESGKEPYGYYLENGSVLYDSNFIDSKKIYPKIYDYVKGEAKSKDFRDINYKIETNQSFYPKRTFVKGELQYVEWFSDTDLTDLVLKVDIEYTRDAQGFAVSRSTTRLWVMTDENDAPDVKVTNKKYNTNPMDQITEGKQRRTNIVDMIQLPTMSFMIETIQGKSVNEILLMGRDFLDRFETYFNRFIKNSSSINDPQDPNFGKKEVVVELENATDTWLDNTPAALLGATIRQWIISEFSI